MKLSLQLAALAAANVAFAAATVKTTTTTGPQFTNGQPIDGNGKGAPIYGMAPLRSGCSPNQSAN